MSGDITDEETSITEITLQSDGRIFIFGLLCEVLDILRELCPKEHPLLALGKQRSESSIE